MPSEKIASNSTVRDILPTLAKPDHFVSSLFGKMNEIEKRRGPCVARIGVLGAGKMPNVKIDAADGSWSEGGFDGVTFATFEESGGTRTTEGTNWSVASMTFDEVRTLLAEIRKWKQV